MKKIFSFLTAILFAGSMWAAVESGTTYSTKSATNFATDWTYDGDFSTSGGGFIKLIASTNYIQTDEFCQGGFTKIKIKARKFGGPNATQGVITVEWLEKNGEPVVLGTVSPSGTSLGDLTISSPAEVTANKKGSIKISCKGASDSKGCGVSEVTITYDEGDCSTKDPYIETNTSSVAFGKKNIYFDENKTGSMDIAVTGGNLNENIAAALSGTNAANFSLSAASFAPTEKAVEATLTVSYEIAEVGDYSATLTLSSEGATSVEIPITLTAINKTAVIYTKVMDDAELTAGDKIVIVNEGNKNAAGEINTSNVLSVINVSDGLDATAGTLTIIDEEVQVFTLGGEEGAWTLTSEAGQLSSTTAKTMIANGSTTWAITITSGDAAPYVSSTVGTLQYNHNGGTNPRFTTYTSAQQAVQFYSIPVPKYAVTFNAPEHGTLVVKKGDDAITSGEKFVSGTEFTVVATPASGYKLTTLTANGTDISTTKAFSIVSETVVVVAVFDVASALDNTSVEGKAVKSIVNGQLVIEKNGVRYNAMGQVIR